MRVTYKNHPDDLKTMQFLLDRQMEILEAAGREEEVGVSRWRRSRRASTCWARAGWETIRSDSVVDRDHRAHDVPNLFLVDGSSFVTSGRNQPTCTIQALAYRAADRMVRAARAGDV